MDTATVLTHYPTWGIHQMYINPPQRHMTETTIPAGVSVVSTSSTDSTARRIMPIWCQLCFQSVLRSLHSHHTKSLHFYRLFDQTLYKHGSPLRYLGLTYTPNYLMRPVLSTPYPLLLCTYSREEPLSIRLGPFSGNTMRCSCH